ncbi:hypothetical protein [Acinetobacter haemolyticus]|uniref:hypothetical protein n=1 Tax=Acinetobacter haemolyticus TaxID=29430 RepID=UPI000D68EDEA|nr:hypothetical protein [Acinetobacter haemolyticus]
MALTQLDTRVALAAQAPQIDFNQLANNTLSLYDNVQQRGQQGVLSRLLAQNMGENGQPDLNKALQSVQSNPRQAYQPALINTLSGLLKQQRAEELKAQQDAEKFKNDSAKTIAETEDKRLGNTQKGQTLLANLIATSTDTTDAARKLSILGQQYGLPKDLIDSTLSDLKNLADNNQGNPEAFKAMQKSFGLLGSDKPIEYLMPNANNVLDNETSVKNNILNNQTSLTNNQNTVRATLSGQQIQKEIADANRKQSDAHFQYQQYIQKNKPIGSFVDIDGYRRVEFADGTSMRSVGEDGQPVKVQVKSATGQMSPTMQKELFETDDAISSGMAVISGLKDALKLNKTSYSGVGAIQRAKGVGFVSDSEEAKNTVLIDNIVTGNALNALKATFGAAPTEGERKILLDLQGSANLPANQREAIWERAIKAAERRVKYNQQKAEALRNGSYTSTTYKAYSDDEEDSPNTEGMSYRVDDVLKAAKARGVSVPEMERIIKSSGGTIVK